MVVPCYCCAGPDQGLEERAGGQVRGRDCGSDVTAGGVPVPAAQQGYERRRLRRDGAYRDPLHTQQQGDQGHQRGLRAM